MNDTQKRIIECFTLLYEKNKLEDISVKMIVEMASISRMTFYYYYKDIYDLYEEYVSMLFDEIEIDLDDNNYEAILNNFIDHALDYKEIISKGINSNMSIYSLDVVRKKFEKIIFYLINKNENSQKIDDLTVKIYASMLTYSISKFIVNGNLKDDKQRVIDIIYEKFTPDELKTLYTYKTE